MDLNGEVPSNFQDEIIKYLQQQERFSVYAECSSDEKILQQEQQLLVDDVTNLIDSMVDLIVKHDARMKAHNQYPLFDLSKIIPEFYIDDDLYEKLEFRESVIISVLDKTKDSLIPRPVGGMCLDIQRATGKNPLVRRMPNFHPNKVPADGVVAAEIIQKRRIKRGHFENTTDLSFTPSERSTQNLVNKLQAEFEISYAKFLVHVSTQFDMRGHNSGSRITAWVDRNFHTLEEKRTEFTIEDNGTLNEKSLYCALQQARYFIKTASTSAENEDSKLYYSLKKCKNLICEGSNFLLMRYLAIQRYIGTFELSTMYIDGSMCRNIYECTGPESCIVNDTKVDACKIYRTVIEECGLTHGCCTVLTLNGGQLLKQEWKGCDYILQLNPLAWVDNAKPVGNVRLRLEHTWKEDVQLYSKYLDEKTLRSMQVKSYLADHPELTDMIKDYVQSVLMMKPKHVLDFTTNHFRQYLPHHIPRNEYFDPGAPHAEKDDDDHDKAI